MPNALFQEREQHARLLARPSGGAGARLSALFRTSLRRSGGRRQVQVADAQARLHDPGCDDRDAPAEGDSSCVNPSAEHPYHTREPAGAGHSGGERAGGVGTGLRLGSLPRARRLLPGLLSWKRGSQEPRARSGAGAIGVAAVPAMPAPGITLDVVSSAPGHGCGDLRAALPAVKMLLAEAQRMGADAALPQLLHAVAHVCSTALAGVHLPCVHVNCFCSLCALNGRL